MEIHNLCREDIVRLFPHSKDNDHFIDWMLEAHSAPIGYSTFKGDNFKLFGDMDKHFDKGSTYPVYDSGEGEFVIGKDGKGYKLTPPKSWTKIKS